MIYTISFIYHGKSYLHIECTHGKYEANQYEAAAVALISTKLEQEGLSENEKLVDVKLVEQNDTTGLSATVWRKKVYVLPIKNAEL